MQMVVTVRMLMMSEFRQPVAARKSSLMRQQRALQSGNGCLLAAAADHMMMKTSKQVSPSFEQALSLNIEALLHSQGCCLGAGQGITADNSKQTGI